MRSSYCFAVLVAALAFVRSSHGSRATRLPSAAVTQLATVDDTLLSRATYPEFKGNDTTSDPFGRAHLPNRCDIADRSDQQRCIVHQIAGNNFTPEYIDDLVKRFFSEDSKFEDPKDSVEGRAAISEYFKELGRLLRLDSCRVHAIAHDGDTWMLSWHQSVHLLAPKKGGGFKAVGDAIEVRGSSWIVFDHANKVVFDRDCLDTLAFYQQIPGFQDTADDMMAKYIKSFT